MMKYEFVQIEECISYGEIGSPLLFYKKIAHSCLWCWRFAITLWYVYVK